MTDQSSTRCSACGSTFTCTPGGECWCMQPPYLPMPTAAHEARCLCPACLERARAAATPARSQPF